MDSLPNYHVEQQRLIAQIAEQQATIERQRLDILEMKHRQDKHKENIIASKLMIEEYKHRLLELENLHGKLVIDE